MEAFHLTFHAVFGLSIVTTVHSDCIVGALVLWFFGKVSSSIVIQLISPGHDRRKMDMIK